MEVVYQLYSGVPGLLEMIFGGPQTYEENNVMAMVGECYYENWDGAINENSRNLLVFQKNGEIGKHRDRVRIMVELWQHNSVSERSGQRCCAIRCYSVVVLTTITLVVCINMVGDSNGILGLGK